MNTTFEQFTATAKANFQGLQGLSNQAYAGVEKLVELNLATSKAVFGESFSHIQSMLGAKDVQEVLALQSGLLKPIAEKSAAYFQHVQSIATESTSDVTKAVEAKIAEAQNTLGNVVENMAKNAPAGTETAVAAFKSAITAGQNAMDITQASAKKAVEAVQTNFKATAAQAVDAVVKASKATKTAKA